MTLAVNVHLDSARLGLNDPRRAYLIQEVAGLRTEIVGHQTARYQNDRTGLVAMMAIYAWLLTSGEDLGLLLALGWWLPVLVAGVVYLRQETIAAAVGRAASYISCAERLQGIHAWENRPQATKRPITELSKRVWGALTALSFIVAFIFTAVLRNDLRTAVLCACTEQPT
ncbi:MAG: hypothetical protein AAFN79_20165 [Pseudomonadota bacterium]